MSRHKCFQFDISTNMLLQSLCSLKNAWGKGGTAQLCAFRHSSADKTDSQRGIRQPAERWVVAISVNGLKRHNTVWNLGSNHKSFLSIEMLKLYGGKRRWYKTDWAGCCLSEVWYFFFSFFFFLEQQCCHASHFALLLYKDFKVLVDDGHSQEDSRTRANRPQEVSHYRQPSYTEATKGSSCGDVPARAEHF